MKTLNASTRDVKDCSYRNIPQAAAPRRETYNRHLFDAARSRARQRGVFKQYNEQDWWGQRGISPAGNLLRVLCKWRMLRRDWLSRRSTIWVQSRPRARTVSRQIWCRRVRRRPRSHSWCSTAKLCTWRLHVKSNEDNIMFLLLFKGEY